MTPELKLEKMIRVILGEVDSITNAHREVTARITIKGDPIPDGSIMRLEAVGIKVSRWPGTGFDLDGDDYHTYDMAVDGEVLEGWRE